MVSHLVILIPLAVLFLINLPLKGIGRALAFLLTLATILWQIILTFGVPAEGWNTPVFAFARWFSFPIAVDSLTLLMLLTIAIVCGAALFVGYFTTAGRDGRFQFVNLLLVALIGMNGVVLTRDIFTMYVFLEITGIASFVLIASGRDKFALEGSFKYLILSAIATVMMLSAIALLFIKAGGTSFTAVAAVFTASASSVSSIIVNPGASHAVIFVTEHFLVLTAVGLFFGGLLIKAGIVPFHGWLADAYSSAPSGASVLLAGIVTKTTGVYTLIRLVTMVFGFSEPIKTVLLMLGAVSIIVGALAALGQSDMKRMLAYSSISQVGYIIIGLGTGTPLGLAGAVFHLFNHAIFKTQLFANAAAVEQATGTRDMDSLGGLSARMPVTGTTSVIAFLSTAGIPPLGGFWSKLIIIIALWTAGYHGYALVAVLAGVLTLAYFLSMQRRVFFGKLKNGLEHIHEARIGVLVPAVILAAITVAVGLLMPYILNTFILPIKAIL